MKTIMLLVLSAVVVGLVGCSCTNPSRGHARAAVAQHNSAIVIDVRTPEEYASGHLQNAINVPVDTIQSRIEKVVPNKSTHILVHCQSGKRAKIAKEILEAKGYRVRDLGSYANAKSVLENEAPR